MWLRRPLDDILSSAAKVAVLRVVLRVRTPLSGREIARRAGVGYSPAYNALQALVASGVLAKQDHGRATAYSLVDPQSPLISGLTDLFDREDRRTNEAASALASGIPHARAIILFGSEARGQARPGSDTDILIVVDSANEATEGRVRDACLALAAVHGLALSWHVVGLDQVREWDEAGEQFWQSVVQDGIWLQGDSLEAMRLKWRLGRTTSGRPGASGM